ncbi:hypothetical protein [Neorhizobium vignae]|uniref:hypothetical protein n=1 Tax=Neorhizobium vignae TaxID=690585 RepID=UPI0012E16886|nr:hypothetical protein [Neorhizobium vignae]
MKTHQLLPVEKAMSMAPAAFDLDRSRLDAAKSNLVGHRLWDLAPNFSRPVTHFPCL